MNIQIIGMGWHSDDEKELGKNPLLLLLWILVQIEIIFFKHKFDKNHDKIKVHLKTGSLLLMLGSTQIQIEKVFNLCTWGEKFMQPLKVKGISLLFSRFNLTLTL